MGELVPVVDTKDRILKFLPPKNIHKNNLRHREAVVYIFDPKGRVYIQKRDGGAYDHSVAGHVRKGERYMAAALREIKEEVGLRLKPKDLKKIKKVYHKTWSRQRKYFNDRFFTLYVVKRPVGQKMMKINRRELEALIPMSIYRIEKIMRKNKMKCKGGFLVSFPIFLKEYVKKEKHSNLLR